MKNNTYQRLSNNAKKSWFLSRFIILIILIIIAVVTTILLDFNKWAFIVGGIIVLSQVLNTFLFPIIEYKQWKYIVSDEKIEYLHGIFFLKTTIIPIVRIQNLKINEGPINRFFKLANIQIFTAGGLFYIPNIDKDVADEICVYIRNIINYKVKVSKEIHDDSEKS